MCCFSTWSRTTPLINVAVVEFLSFTSQPRCTEIYSWGPMISIGFGDSDFDPQNAIETQVMRPDAARKLQPEDMNFYNVTPELLAATGSTGSPVLLAPLGV